MSDDKDDFYDEKIYTLEDIEKCLEEADKRDGITDENREEMIREAVKDFIETFSLFCAYPDKEVHGLEEDEEKNRNQDTGDKEN